MSEKNKKRYHKLKSEHRCTNCGHADERTLQGFSCCEKCRKVREKYRKKYYSEHKEDLRFQSREWQYARYYKLLREHKCVRCGNPLSENYFYTQCENCKKREKERRMHKKEKTAKRGNA